MAEEEGFRYFNGLVCVIDGQRHVYPFEVDPCELMRAERIPYANHPAVTRQGGGKWVIATSCIPAGTTLGLYAGRIEGKRDLDRLPWSNYHFDVGDDEEYVIDARVVGNELRFINDYRNTLHKANIKVELYTMPEYPYYTTVEFITTRRIRTGEELLLDYGEEYWEAQQAHYRELRPHKCPQCVYRSNRTMNVDRHISYVHTPKNQDFKCKQCERILKTRDSLIDHYRIHDNLRSIRCPFPECKHRTNTIGAMKFHRSSKHRPADAAQFVCYVCEEKLSSRCSLRRHTKKLHVITERPLLKCKYEGCTTTSINPEYIKEHQRDCTFQPGGGGSVCTHCSARLVNTKVLRRHIRLKHRDTVEFISCKNPDCEAVFDSEAHLEGHLRKSKCPVKTWTKVHCKLCNKTFSNMDNYKAHANGMAHMVAAKVRIPAGKAHMCLECRIAFPSVKYLRLHYKTKQHTAKDRGKGNFHCALCRWSFPSLEKLEKHRTFRFHRYAELNGVPPSPKKRRVE